MRTMLCLSVFATALLVSGCSGLRHYPNTLKKNLIVKTNVDDGVRVSMHVYKVDANCKTGYEGTVFIRSKKEVGIPSGKPSYLVFKFERSSFLSGRSSTTYKTLLRPKKGKLYKAKAVYKDDLYDVEIIETGSGKSRGRVVEQRPFDACGSL